MTAEAGLHSTEQDGVARGRQDGIRNCRGGCLEVPLPIVYLHSRPCLARNEVGGSLAGARLRSAAPYAGCMGTQQQHPKLSPREAKKPRVP